jgi:hypothetical protein
VTPLPRCQPCGEAAKNEAAALSSTSTNAALSSEASHKTRSRASSAPAYLPPSQFGRYVTITGSLVPASSVGRSAAGSKPSKKSKRSSTTSAPAASASRSSTRAAWTVVAVMLVVSKHVLLCAADAPPTCGSLRPPAEACTRAILAGAVALRAVRPAARQAAGSALGLCASAWVARTPAERRGGGAAVRCRAETAQGSNSGMAGPKRTRGVAAHTLRPRRCSAEHTRRTQKLRSAAVWALLTSRARDRDRACHLLKRLRAAGLARRDAARDAGPESVCDYTSACCRQDAAASQPPTALPGALCLSARSAQQVLHPVQDGVLRAGVSTRVACRVHAAQRALEGSYGLSLLGISRTAGTGCAGAERLSARGAHGVPRQARALVYESTK